MTPLPRDERNVKAHAWWICYFFVTPVEMLEFDMPERVKIDFLNVPLWVRRKKTAKRMSLRISPRDGGIWLTLPHYTALADGIGFVHEKKEWLRAHAQTLETVHPLTFGETIFVSGRAYVIEPSIMAQIEMEESTLFVKANEAQLGAKLRAYLKERARAHFLLKSEEYASLINRRFTRITLRDTRSRWGSCTSKGALMYSWRLAMAPLDVQNYVAAHEVSHLAHMNHSDAFWKQVRKICPNYQRHRNWLKEHGAKLQCIQF